MAMVEWTRLSGDQVEELVAILLCRKHPEAVRVRPSTGDGGIDLLVPTAAGGSEVYQVKRFSSNLTASQKSQIRESLRRLERHSIDHTVTVSAWHLTLPLDPTKENLHWLSETTKCLPYPCDWRGLSFIDGLAAEFPDVVDYYIRDGRQRLEAVVGQLTSAMGMNPKDGDGLLSPSQLRDYLQSLSPVLDTDPHFRYEVSLGPERSEIPPEPELILTTMQRVGDGTGNAVTVRVFPRFAAALDFRPIPIDVAIRVEPGSQLQDDLASFIKYGTSVLAPVGTVDVRMELPGGLGGNASNAGLRIEPSSRPEPSQVLRMAAVDPGDCLIESVLIDMQPATFGIDGTGAARSGAERCGNFRVQLLSDRASKTMNLTISDIDVAGNAPHDVVPALRFLNALRPPNRIAIVAQRGPIGSSMALPDDFALPDGDLLQLLAGAAASLATLQEHTTEQLAMPSSVSALDAANWSAAEQLLLGEVVELKTTEFRACLHPGVSPPSGQSAIAFYSEFAVTVGATEVPIGTLLAHCLVADVDPTSVKPHHDHIDCKFRPADDARVTARLVRSAGPRYLADSPMA
ncbi:PDDEXK family nuclease [Parenemella sanctibonifatiensis]|uniref:Uncharacterized protein n=1 Tax=Parenemella sanctibonifatiensis TaxID=2016505 RepID=A0A255EC23_9ACTN|nr:restriction endonuclease [Parenemella sanctibonifatiensis]OYN88471.1 hypothetical protein CGZ92_04335 [Parenemella sanctibonifatiensis]